MATDMGRCVTHLAKKIADISNQIESLRNKPYRTAEDEANLCRLEEAYWDVKMDMDDLFDPGDGGGEEYEFYSEP